jgi:ABC-type nitrate/sulfonate/bicarbonate transport system permease component
MTNEIIIRDAMRKVSRQSYWFGLAVGILIGAVTGFAIGYSQVGQTVVVPLSRGIEV